MRLLTRIIVFFVLTGSILPQSPVTFCDLVRNPEKYNGKEVIVRATYTYGFEWSYLHCLDCLDQGKVWLEMPTDSDSATDRSLKKMPGGSGIVNLTVQGIFASGGGFGHQNAYPYKIEVYKIRNVVVLEKGMKPLKQEAKVEKRWACGGTDPK